MLTTFQKMLYAHFGVSADLRTEAAEFTVRWLTALPRPQYVQYLTLHTQSLTHLLPHMHPVWCYHGAVFARLPAPYFTPRALQGYKVLVENVALHRRYAHTPLSVAFLVGLLRSLPLSPASLTTALEATSANKTADFHSLLQSFFAVFALLEPHALRRSFAQLDEVIFGTLKELVDQNPSLLPALFITMGPFSPKPSPTPTRDNENLPEIETKISAFARNLQLIDEDDLDPTLLPLVLDRCCGLLTASAARLYTSPTHTLSALGFLGHFLSVATPSQKLHVKQHIAPALDSLLPLLTSLSPQTAFITPQVRAICLYELAELFPMGPPHTALASALLEFLDSSGMFDADDPSHSINHLTTLLSAFLPSLSSSSSPSSKPKNSLSLSLLLHILPHLTGALADPLKTAVGWGIHI
eukprot:GCRY01008958.1.p1 GENE.GCRY01008958.1~~GCRY01008958.1.p1  ORF type:complete len:412 (+),score=143.90 GCRY01008958.1:112-1347(+)